MKTRFITLISILIVPLGLFAQSDSLFQSTEVQNIIYVFDFKNSKSILSNFMRTNNVKVISQNESRTDLDIKVILYQETYLLLDF